MGTFRMWSSNYSLLLRHDFFDWFCPFIYGVCAVPELWKCFSSFQVRAVQTFYDVKLTSGDMVFLLLWIALYYELSDLYNVICCRSTLNDDLQLCPFCTQPFSGNINYLVIYLLKFLKILQSFFSWSWPWAIIIWQKFTLLVLSCSHWTFFFYL